jgi:hypothetical protein
MGGGVVLPLRPERRRSPALPRFPHSPPPIDAKPDGWKWRRIYDVLACPIKNAGDPKMNVPHDHHFIPVFYLKRWVGTGGKKLVEYTLKNRKLIAKPVGPRATGFQTDLYSFPELPPEIAQYVEQEFFQYADDKASDALALHLNGPPTGWNSELRSAWSRFIIGIHMRHPDAMPELRAAAAAIWEGSASDACRNYERFRQPADPATHDQYLAERDPLTPVKACVNLIMAAIDNFEAGTHINQMTWAIVDVSTARDRLLTSD